MKVEIMRAAKSAAGMEEKVLTKEKYTNITGCVLK
jgi:hypothetical protein